ncbi:MAG: right-handed parallel beta-helix repeat-containing protein [Planctomycetes bacterium]|nr:right-handed parallel beta-helix repeat-containing protein [Planctomycetota bacterium]
MRGIAAGLFLLAVPVLPALATDVSGDQSGVWSLAGSPYNLVGDVRVPPAASLVIEPGVEVIGQGHYIITVDTGAILTAAGSADMPILFTAVDGVTGWRGMRLEGADSASEISYCIFEYARGVGDYPEVRGGALMIKNCSPLVSYSEFRESSSKNTNRNGTGGGICTESSSAQILYNFVHDNEADSGGGICITEYGTPLVKGNVIVDNRAINGGGGMYFGARSSPIIESNWIMRNYSSGWGGGGINCWNSYIFYNTYPTIRNNVIAHNSTSAAGGGLYCRYDRAVLTNNLIAYNSAYYGGGIHALNQGYSAPIVRNCLIGENTATVEPQIDLEESTGSQISVSYSDVEGGYVGNGNIDIYPEFVDPDGADNIAGTEDDNYRLASGSPCIDAGDNYALDGGVVEDMDGNPRYVDDPATPDTGNGTAPIIDMGPYEYQGASFVLLDPVPGVAGQVNRFEAQGGSPGELVYFAYGVRSGSTGVPGCPGLTVDLADASLIDSAPADGAGTAIMQTKVPGKAQGRLVLLQAVDRSECQKTSVVEFVFE